MLPRHTIESYRLEWFSCLIRSCLAAHDVGLWSLPRDFVNQKGLNLTLSV